MKRIGLFAGAVAFLAATAFSGCSSDLTSADEDSVTITEQGSVSGKILERGFNQEDGTLDNSDGYLDNQDDGTTTTDSTGTATDYPTPSSSDSGSKPNGKGKG